MTTITNPNPFTAGSTPLELASVGAAAQVALTALARAGERLHAQGPSDDLEADLRDLLAKSATVLGCGMRVRLATAGAQVQLILGGEFFADLPAFDEVIAQVIRRGESLPWPARARDRVTASDLDRLEAALQALVELLERWVDDAIEDEAELLDEVVDALMHVKLAMLVVMSTMTTPQG